MPEDIQPESKEIAPPTPPFVQADDDAEIYGRFFLMQQGETAIVQSKKVGTR